VVEKRSPLDKYIELARKANTHPAKFSVLSKLLEEVFNVKLEELLPGIEKKIGSKILGVRGSIDLLYSNVIFEVKVDLEKELDDAKEELKKYFQAMFEARPGGRFVGIATDVINYRAFLPVIEDSIVKGVKEIALVNISEVSDDEAILWLDSYIFSKHRIRPTANDLKFRFGPGSPTYAMVIEALEKLYNSVKEEEDVKLKHELWSKSIEIVYGSKPKVEAFIDYTYLVTLIKLIVYFRLSGNNVVTKEKILEALTGEYFIKHGITNLVEEDFFTLIIHPKILNTSLELITKIAKELLRYDLTQIDEDFFKEIYQEIVERGQRHRIGEYYTPEWLTELVLEEVMKLWEEKHSDPPRILDPACGSGTFLCNAIRMLKEELTQKGWKPPEILNFILANVVGVDVNPLAVTIARANYIITLGELLHTHTGSIMIPVYVADSINFPKTIRALIENIELYDYVVNGTHLQMPIEVAKDRSKLGKVITAFKEAIGSYKSRRDRNEAYKVFERALEGFLTDAEFNVLKITLNNILSLIDKGRNSIWIYMLSNIYMPIALSKSKFDVIVGNPPWIAMRYIESMEYQDFVKNKVFEYDLLEKSQVKQFSNMEVATLFFCMACDLYLRDNGIIGFVMPRSVLTGALHHVKFKKFKKPSMTLLRILDLEDVTPLFNVPSCVLIAVKGGETSYPVLAKKFSGRLPERNLRLSEAVKHLKTSDYMYKPPPAPSTKYSEYYEKFKRGADIYPRNFWFIEFVAHPTLGINVSTPYVKTLEGIEAKEQWKGIKIEGNVEVNFIYATLLGSDLVPFGYNIFQAIVLPVELTVNGYSLLDVHVLRSRGFVHMANWLERVQKMWEERATKRALKDHPRVISWINYMNKLTNQNPRKRYVVLYNTSGKNITSCVIDRKTIPSFKVLNAEIKPINFIADTSTYVFGTDLEEEAHYLCAILNSDIVNQAIKPSQTKGLYGERTIHKRPLMLPIPKFDLNNPIHRRLAELSKKCHDKTSKLMLTSKRVAGRRKEAKEVIKEELEEINRLVSQLLNIG